MTEQLTYIMICRLIVESPIWSDSPELLKLFIYLIIQARYKKEPKRYHDCECKRGEIITSLGDIAKDNSYFEKKKLKTWSRAKVGRMIEKLCGYGYIKLIPDTHGTHIRVINYNKFQDCKTYIPNSSETIPNSSETIVNTNNNDNKGNNEKNVDCRYSEIFDFWNSKKIIEHSSVEKYQNCIKAKLKKFSSEEIKQAIDNYSKILKKNDYWLTYRWTLGEFFKRDNGFEKFLNKNNPLENYRNSQKKVTSNNPDRYSKVSDFSKTEEGKEDW